MADKRYYVVEARLPIEIPEALSPEEAARFGARQISAKYGIDISNWYLRVFEYGGEPDEFGVVAEYFSNPSGSKFRKIDQNVQKHEELIKEGKTP